MWARIKNAAAWIWGALAVLVGFLLWRNREKLADAVDSKKLSAARTAVAVADAKIARLEADKADNAEVIEQVREERREVQREIVAQVKAVEGLDDDALEDEFNALY